MRIDFRAARKRIVELSRKYGLAIEPDAVLISPGPGRPEDAGISNDVIRTFAGVVPVLGVIAEQLGQFDRALAQTKLPERPNYELANSLLIKARRQALSEELP